MGQVKAPGAPAMPVFKAPPPFPPLPLLAEPDGPKYECGKNFCRQCSCCLACQYDCCEGGCT